MWASINGISSVDILPAKLFFVAIYLSSLVQSCHTVSPVTQAFYSLQWAHNLIGQPSPIPLKIQHTQVNMHKLYVEKINNFLYN
jgi:hypothetical protein